MDDSLRQFVRDALSAGVGKDEIRRALLAARWPEDEVRGALDSFADLDFPLPVPRPKPYLPARDAFLYLVLFTLLYVSAWNLGSLLFDLIERWFPDAAQPSWRAQLSSMRWSLASMMIAFPGYLWLSRRSYVAARRDPDKRQSRVRKWLTYLTLFLAAGTLLGDLITLVFNLLEGELTTRFVLKVLTVAAIAGSIFGYYLWDLRQDDLEPAEVERKHPGLRLFAAAVSAAVLATIGIGLFVAGSPGRARQLQLDEQRVRRLVAISKAIDRYWGEFEALPDDLVALEQTRGYSIEPLDPDSAELFEYAVNGQRSYELCAVFDRASADQEAALSPPRGSPRSDSKFWRHGAGRSCFAIEVRSDSSADDSP